MLDMLGWLPLPSDPIPALLAAIILSAGYLIARYVVLPATAETSVVVPRPDPGCVTTATLDDTGNITVQVNRPAGPLGD